MIIMTRYRDIPFSEVCERHPAMADCKPQRWEKRMRGRKIWIETPPIPREALDADQRSCGQDWYRVVTKKGVYNVCPHLAEIGD